MKLVWYLLAVCLRSFEVNLLNLYKTWQGYGKAFQLPNQLVILSSRLQEQVGLLTMDQIVSAGKRFELEISFNLNDEDEKSKCGFGLSMGQTPVQINNKNYTY